MCDQKTNLQAGHLPGSKSAPGGQLVQATDEYIGVRNARLVLIDDTEVRSTMTASWLIQMGWPEVYVLAGGIPKEGLETGSVSVSCSWSGCLECCRGYCVVVTGYVG